jgi:hypothetical protein
VPVRVSRAGLPPTFASICFSSSPTRLIARPWIFAAVSYNVVRVGGDDDFSLDFPFSGAARSPARPYRKPYRAAVYRR